MNRMFAVLYDSPFFGKHLWVTIGGRRFGFKLTDEEWAFLEQHLEQKT